MGGCKRRRVIQPVAEHGDPPPVAGHGSYAGDLVFGTASVLPRIQAGSTCDSGDGVRRIAGQDERPKATVAEPFDQVLQSGPQRLREPESGKPSPGHPEPEFGEPVRGGGLFGAREHRRAQSFAAVRLETEPGKLPHAVKRPRRIRARQRPAEWVQTGRGQGRRLPRQVRVDVGVENELRAGQGAGLVENDISDFRQSFERAAIADDDATGKKQVCSPRRYRRGGKAGGARGK